MVEIRNGIKSGDIVYVWLTPHKEKNEKKHEESEFKVGKFISDINKQMERDIRKRQYCIDNNIKLIEIDGREFEKHVENLTVDRIKNILGRNGIIV